jgi:hypothetical protein
LGSLPELWPRAKHQCVLSVASTLFTVVAPHSHLWLDGLSINWAAPPDAASPDPLLVAHGNATHLWVTNSTFVGYGLASGVKVMAGTRVYFGGAHTWRALCVCTFWEQWWGAFLVLCVCSLSCPLEEAPTHLPFNNMYIPPCTPSAV